MAKVIKKIAKKELDEKIGPENLALVENNVYCAECGPTAITGYKKNIVIDQSGDTIIRGHCKKCGHEVARLLETGETK